MICLFTLSHLSLYLFYHISVDLLIIMPTVLFIIIYVNVKIQQYIFTTHILLLIDYNIRKISSMRYSQRYRKQIIPQWKYCYLNYDHLKKIVKIVRESVRERLELSDILHQGSKQQIRIQQSVSIVEVPISQANLNLVHTYYQYFYNQSEWANKIFCQTHIKNMQVFTQFAQFKFNQIKQSFQLVCKFHFTGGQLNNKKRNNSFKHYLQNLFVQSLFLARMMQSCIEAQRRILTKHKLYATNIFTTPQQLAQTRITIDECHKQRRKIQRFYFKTVKNKKQKNRWRLRKLAEQKQIKPKQTLVIGLLIGAIVTIIVFLIIILDRASVTLQSDSIFNMDFPMWRGICLILFFLWAFGVDLLYFQKYGVNYRIIFENHQSQTPISSDLFRISAFFSVIFIILFILYSLQIADIIETGYFAPQWFPLFSWGIFILFLFNPFPVLYFHGRLYFFKLIVKMFSTYIFLPTFPAVWVTAQTLSLLNIFQDFVYTFCYYTHLNLPFPVQQVQQVNICRPPAVLARFIYTIVIYSIRITQCLRNGFSGRRVQFINAFKFCLALLTAILAYVYKDANNSNIFPVWLTFAIISTLASFAWDTKMGWDLLNRKSKNFMLRDQLLYPKINYYIWTIVNFVLRSAWTLNISQNIVRDLFVSPQIFTLSFGFLQIFRRGMWNLVRVQVQQINNNLALSTLPKQQSKFQKQITQYLKKQQGKLNQVSLQKLYETQKQIFIKEQTFQQNYNLKEQKQKIINKVSLLKNAFEEKQKQLQKNQKQIKDKISQLMQNIY